MASKRYTFVLTDVSSGTSRAVTLGARPMVALACAALAVPMIAGGMAWKGRHQVAVLQTENANYRAATAELSEQIASLQSAVGDLDARSALDPDLAGAMDRLPALVKARAMGGGDGSPGYQETSKAIAALTGPDDTFGVLRGLLDGLQSRLLAVGGLVDRRNALAAATPSLWPTRGWLTSTMGRRYDPMTGLQEFHAGLDIAAEQGTPVYATADGTVKQIGYQHAYGRLIVLDHGFGLESRYGHLSAFNVERDQRVKRGDVLGRVGATGRATGPHLHYEVHANGRLLNPLQLLTQKPRDR